MDQKRFLQKKENLSTREKKIWVQFAKDTGMVGIIMNPFICWGHLAVPVVVHRETGSEKEPLNDIILMTHDWVRKRAFK